MPEVNRLIGKHLFPGVGSNIASILLCYLFLAAKISAPNLKGLGHAILGNFSIDQMVIE